MDDLLYDKLILAPSFIQFINTNSKRISEEDYYLLCDKCCDEAGIGYPKNWNTMGVYSKMGWSQNRRMTFYELFKTTGVKIKWSSDFEERLKIYLKEQKDKPETPFAQLEWYSQKRKELEEIIAEEEKDYD